MGKKGFRDQSIEVKGDWPIITEFSKNHLEKLNPLTPAVVGVPVEAGEVFKYNTEFDKSRPQKSVPLGSFQGDMLSDKSILDDPVFRRLAQENKADIFATEVAIAAIMTAPKSIYSWDVIIKKYQDKVFIDKRDEPNILDNLTVNETSNENQPIDDQSVNGVR